MKKIVIYTLCVFLGLQACKKDTALIDDTLPEERVAQNLEAYRTALTTAPNGWKGTLKTSQLGGAYSFYFEFGTNDRVKMLADYDAGSASDLFESTYRLKQVMAPTLIFDTYSYIHFLSDPDPLVFGGNTGAGFGSDFEFEFREMKGDTIRLIGKKRNTELVLIKATAGEKTFYTSGGFGALIEDVDTFLATNRFLYILDPEDPSKKIQVFFDTNKSGKEAFLVYSDAGGTVQAIRDVFSFSISGLELSSGLTFKTVSIKSVYINKVSGNLMGRLSGGGEVEIKNSPTSIYPLHSLIGLLYNTIDVPQTANAGWSLDFTNKRAAAAASMLAGTYRLTMRNMTFTFNTLTKTMDITVTIFQGATGFVAVFPYTYTKSTNGTFDFTAQTPAGNAVLIATDMKAITDQIRNDLFVLDYFISPSTGVLGQFKSVTNPAFYFAGALSR